MNTDNLTAIDVLNALYLGKLSLAKFTYDISTSVQAPGGRNTAARDIHDDNHDVTNQDVSLLISSTASSIEFHRFSVSSCVRFAFSSVRIRASVKIISVCHICILIAHTFLVDF